MPTIDSVEFYLSRTANRTGWYLHLDVHEATEYTVEPDVGSILGSKLLLVDNVPLHANKGWVSFTFDSPIEINEDGFYGLHLWGDTYKYQMNGVWLYTTTDWIAATIPEPFTGMERGWRNGAFNNAYKFAYKINCSGCEGNSAIATTDSYYYGNATILYGLGVRSFVAPSITPPGKARYPTPADDAEKVAIRGIDALKYLQWEAPE